MRRTSKPKPASSILFDRLYKGKPKERLEEAAQTIAELTLGDQIRSLREEAGLTQAQLAERVGTQPTHISRIEDADYNGHSVETLRRIAKALHRKLHIEFVPESTDASKKLLSA
jgi:ribosome-binding protein aMBF1 (putative translation factor)